MEEPQPGQDPLIDRKAEDGPEPGRPSVAPSDAPQSATERRLIDEGQDRAARDTEELRRNGFGHHIGAET